MGISRGEPTGESNTETDDETIRRYLGLAIDLAAGNVLAGGGPFGAVVVGSDGQSFSGVNRVASDNDPTAHGEVVAIRRACGQLETFDLGGAVLYSSCEPCPLCLSAALWARIGAVYYAADRFDAARAGFDDALFYEFLAGSRPELMSVRQLRTKEASRPFETWSVSDTRTRY